MSRGMAWRIMINPARGLSYIVSQVVGTMEGKVGMWGRLCLQAVGENVNKDLNSIFTIAGIQTQRGIK